MVLRAQRILSPGTRIGGYRIEAEIGRGAMAVVYRAIQLNLERPVALKVLSDELAADAEFVGRFFNEARAAAALSHAHIIQAYDAGVAEGNIHYFAMEYVEGETLQQRIRRQGYLRPGPGIELASDIADALNYGWLRQRLTHGDIKPENIMINQAGESKLADFGLAKVAGHDVRDGPEILLTPLYAAPEVIRGQRPKDDCRPDIYSFGATLYHVFAGTPPFPGEKAQEVMQRHLNEALEPLRQRNPAVPGRISDLVGSLLAKEPAQRPGDWETVLKSLREIRKVLTEPSAAHAAAAPVVHLRMRDVRRAQRVDRPRRRRRVGWAVGGVIVVVLLVAGALVAQRRFGLGTLGSGGGPGAIPDGDPLPAGASADEPGEGAGGAAGPARPDTDDEWSQVRARAQQAPTPQQALALLQEYGRRRQGALPAEYAAVLAEYAGAAGGAPATGTSPGTPPTPAPDAPGATGPVPGEGTAAPSTPAAGGGAVATDSGPPTATGLPRPGDGVPASAGTSAGGPIAIVATPADQRADAFVAFMAQISRLEFAIPLQIEPSVEAAQKWLLQFPDDSQERAQVAFVLSTVLPALDEVVPKLVAHSEALAGAKLSGREYARCAVREVTLAGLVLQEQTQHGVMLRNLPWPRVENLTSVLLQLSRVAAGKSPATWTDRRPWLALLLFTGNAKLLDEAVAGLPETPEKADWERLRLSLAKAVDEGKALRLWQKAADACAAGERTVAHRLLLDFRATRSHVGERYAKLVGGLLAELAGTVPDVQGGRLVREAGELVDSDPTGALVRVLLAGTRYGDADFPEKARLERIRRAAVAELPLADWEAQQVRRHPLLSLVPFASSPDRDIPCLGVRLHQVASDAASELPPRTAEMLPTLEGPALLELGDWDSAARLEARLQEGALAALPDAARAAACFSRGLTAARYGVTAEKAVVAEVLRCLPEADAGGDGQYAMLAQALALEYGLFLRCGETDLALYLAGGEAPRPRGPAKQRSRVLLGLAALAVERRQSEYATRLVPALTHADTGIGEWGLSEAEAGLIHQAMAKTQDGRALMAALSRVPERGLGERHIRLAVAAALAAGPLADELWLKLSEWVDLKGSTFGPVGGAAVYDAVLARAGHRLAAADPAGAAETVTWALSLTHPCLAPYYARLVFVRWGLTRLQGPAGVRELAEVVDAAAAANRTEKALAKVFLGDAPRDRAKEAVRDNPEGRFWYDWLLLCENCGPRSGKSDGGRHPERFASARLPRAEQVLADGLIQWAGRPADKPRPGPGPDALPAGG